MRQIFVTIQCVIQGSAGFRCVSRIFSLIQEALSIPFFPTPAFSTARDWLLKLGLFNLTKPKEEGEWVLIVDCSIQMGSMKCLLILGARMETLKGRKDFKLSHSDVEPLVLKTIESCNAEVVKKALDEAKSKTGPVVAILSDEGSPLKKGVRLFQEEQEKKPIHLHDIMHKADLILKKELEADIKWKEFTKQMTHTTQQLKLSASSHLIPPKQRQKRRIRSEIKIIYWGVKILRYLDSGMANELEKEKLSWVLKYRRQLKIYKEISIFFDMSTKEVREQGYSQETVKILKERGKLIRGSKRSRSFFSKILKTIEIEAIKVPQNKQLLGCSEVIESIFGKFKQLEKSHSSGGLTSLVLSLPALVGKISANTVKAAMEGISIGRVKEWIKENLGCTFWSKRRCNLSSHKDNNNFYLEKDELIESLIC